MPAAVPAPHPPAGNGKLRGAPAHPERAPALPGRDPHPGKPPPTCAPSPPAAPASCPVSSPRPVPPPPPPAAQPWLPGSCGGARASAGRSWRLFPGEPRVPQPNSLPVTHLPGRRHLGAAACHMTQPAGGVGGAVAAPRDAGVGRRGRGERLRAAGHVSRERRWRRAGCVRGAGLRRPLRSGLRAGVEGGGGPGSRCVRGLLGGAGGRAGPAGRGEHGGAG